MSGLLSGSRIRTASSVLINYFSPPCYAGGLVFYWRYFLSFSLSPLSFDKEWTDRNAVYCINTVDENVTTAKNLVNFGQGTLCWQPMLCLETATCWHTPPWLFVLAFYNGWERRLFCEHRRNLNCQALPITKIWGCCSTPAIFLLISMAGAVHTWPKYAVRWFLKVIR